MRVTPLHLSTGLVVGFILGCVGSPPKDTSTPAVDPVGDGSDADTDTDTDTDTDSDTDVDSDTDTDTDTDTDADTDTDPPADTGIAYLGWTSHIKYTGKAITAERGISAFETSSWTSACANLGEWSSSTAAKPLCPDCDYAFTGSLSGGANLEGAYCNAFTGGGDLWPGNYPLFYYYYTYLGLDTIDGWGFGATYDLNYSGSTFSLTDVIWMHTSGYTDTYGDYQSPTWRYGGGWNLPDQGLYYVQGNKNEATSFFPFGSYYYFFYK